MGWRVIGIRGSHYKLETPDGKRIVMPVHKGRPIKQGTLRGVLAAAGVSEDEFLKQY